MGLFGFGKKVQWDEERSNENIQRMQSLFNQVVEDNEGYQLAYGYTTDVKTMNYVLARKTTYLYGSLIIGFRRSDMSIVIVQTVPELDGCGDPTVFKKGEIKKAKIVQGGFTIYHPGGMMAGYTQFYIMDGYNEDYFAYIHQPDQASEFDGFWKEFTGK